MEEVDKGCLMIRMGVSGQMGHLGSPGQRPLNGCVCAIILVPSQEIELTYFQST